MLIPKNVRNLVFEGGGVKICGLVGAIQVLEERGIVAQTKDVAGTSAGSIIAALVAAGMSPQDIREFALNLNFRDLLDGSWVPGADKLHILTEWGQYRGDAFLKLMRELMEKCTGNSRITFGDLRELTGKGLHVVTTNVTRRYSKIFSDERTPDMEVALAVRMSMSIPFFFFPVKWEDELYVDGGMMNNFPIDILDRRRFLDQRDHGGDTPRYDEANAYVEEHPDECNEFLSTRDLENDVWVRNWETIGVKTDSTHELAYFAGYKLPDPQPVNHVLQHALALFECSMRAQDEAFIGSPDAGRSIGVDTGDTRFNNFDIGQEEKLGLIDSGIAHATRSLDAWEQNAS